MVLFYGGDMTGGDDTEEVIIIVDVLLPDPRWVEVPVLVPEPIPDTHVVSGGMDTEANDPSVSPTFPAPA